MAPVLRQQYQQNEVRRTLFFCVVTQLSQPATATCVQDVYRRSPRGYDLRHVPRGLPQMVFISLSVNFSRVEGRLLRDNSPTRVQLVRHDCIDCYLPHAGRAAAARLSATKKAAL